MRRLSKEERAKIGKLIKPIDYIDYDEVKQVIETEKRYLMVRCYDWESNMDSTIEYYCRADKIGSDTAIINVCNVVNHASEIKAYKRAIDTLDEVLRKLEMIQLSREEK